MTVWEFMEMIHSRSYTYIIKNVYSNPSEVFDTILTDQRILERAGSVTEAYNDFIKDAQEYGSSNAWQHAIDGADLSKKPGMNSNGNSSEQSQMSTFWKAYDSMSHSLAHLHLVSSNSWKGVLKLYPSSPGMKTST